MCKCCSYYIQAICFNTLDSDQSIFQRDISKELRKLPDQKQAIKEFLDGFSKVIEQPQRYATYHMNHYAISMSYSTSSWCFTCWLSIGLDSVGVCAPAL